MNNQKKSSASALPDNLPEELLPVYDWWKANGNQFLITLAVIAIVYSGLTAYRRHRATKIANANQELLQANGIEDLEAAVNKYAKTKPGNAMRLRLAKAYYDAGNYKSALETYDVAIAKGVPRGFEDIAAIGRACSLEGDGQTEAALAAFREFQKKHPESFLVQQAQFGEARTLCLSGNKPEALKLLEDLKAKATGQTETEQAITALSEIIERYEPRAAKSLFDLADEAGKKVAADAIPALKPVEEAAPAVKPAETPAPAPASAEEKK